MKLHIGCGSVYLHGWVNVDVPSPLTFLAADRPDLVERLGTTEDRYYARHQDKNINVLRSGPLQQEYVCDRYGSFSFLPVAEFTREILTRQSFEHLSSTEAVTALIVMRASLAPGGLLRIDVPDHDETLRLYKETGDDFYKRHLLGPRRDDFGYHMRSYTRESLKRLVEREGFSMLCEEPNIHFFPAFCLRFVRT